MLALVLACGSLAVTPARAAQYAALVLDADSGRVILEENSAARTYPASLTKIMTLYLVFDAIKAGRLTLDQSIRVSAHAAAQPPSKLGLRAGSSIKVRDAIMSLITRSANDMAMALAEAVGGSEDRFAAAMTARARMLGMSSTVFRNPSGLPDDAQHTNARDMAKLGMAIMRDHADYYPYFATQNWKFAGRVIRNHNRMLGRYRGVNGIKTGYIRASGFNLVVSVERDGRHLVGVIFGGRSARSRDDQMIVLLDRAFGRLKQSPQTVAKAEIIRPNMVAPVALAAIEPPTAVKRPEFEADLFETAQIEAAEEVDIQALTAAAAAALDAKIAALDEDAADTDEAYRAEGTADTDAVNLAVATTDIPKPAQPAPNTLGAQLAAQENALHGKAPTVEGWGVQVGAFSAEKTAVDHLKETAQLIPELADTGRMAVLQSRDRGSVLYRARFVGMTEMSAREMCLALREKDRACIAVKVKATLAASTVGVTTSSN